MLENTDRAGEELQVWVVSVVEATLTMHRMRRQVERDTPTTMSSKKKK